MTEQSTLECAQGRPSGRPSFKRSFAFAFALNLLLWSVLVAFGHLVYEAVTGAQGEGQRVAAQSSVASDSKPRTPYAEQIDVRALRTRVGLSRQQFAGILGIGPLTLEDWELGRTSPEGPARALLYILQKEPKSVMWAFEATAR